LSWGYVAGVEISSGGPDARISTVFGSGLPAPICRPTSPQFAFPKMFRSQHKPSQQIGLELSELLFRRRRPQLTQIPDHRQH
jgi:hypothetical protein